MQTLFLGNIALKLKGDWDDATAYIPNDAVSFADIVWGAMRATIPGEKPGVSLAWMRLFEGITSGGTVQLVDNIEPDLLTKNVQLRHAMTLQDFETLKSQNNGVAPPGRYLLPDVETAGGHFIDVAPSPNTIPLRGINGRVGVGDPAKGYDAVPFEVLISSSIIGQQFIYPSSNRRGFMLSGGTYIHITDSSGSMRVFSNHTDLDIPDAQTLLDAGAAFANGKDYYIYLCLEGQNGLELKVSLNSTYPAGHDMYTSRKIGGFHTLCANAGTIPNFTWADISYSHPLSGYLAGDILPRSLWDLQHRPTCDACGMVNLSLLPDRWVDIYLMSGTGGLTKSVFQGTITRSRQYHRMLEEDLIMVGKTGLSSVEFTAAARGSNERTAVAGASEAGATSGGAGGRLDTAGRRMLSADGCEEMCGSLWQALEAQAGGYISQSGISGWDGAGAGDSGQVNTALGTAVGFTGDGPFKQTGGRGDLWGAAGVLLAGGYWAYGASCGSAARNANSARSSASTGSGCRGVARSRSWR